MHHDVVQLLKQGAGQTLSEPQRKKLNDMKYADAFDADLQPRAGLIGRIMDCWDQAIHGESRVPLEEVREKASELAQSLSDSVPES